MQTTLCDVNLEMQFIAEIVLSWNCEGLNICMVTSNRKVTNVYKFYDSKIWQNSQSFFKFYNKRSEILDLRVQHQFNTEQSLRSDSSLLAINYNKLTMTKQKCIKQPRKLSVNKKTPRNRLKSTPCHKKTSTFLFFK